MTDANIGSPASVSSSSSSSLSSNFRIKIKRSLSKDSITNRRSKRHRKNVQSSMRSSSLATTIFHENNPMNGSSSSTTNHNQSVDKDSSLVPLDKLVFSTNSTMNSKASFWTVTDRQSEWYKLSIPIHQSISNPTNTIVPFKRLVKVPEKKKSKTNKNDRIDQPTDKTQLIMKAVMHELDYDINDDDLEFLYELNRCNKAKQKRQLSEEEFENAIIILEFSTAEKIRSYLKQKSCEDDAIVCDICLLPDADDGNEMVFCERCNCCVHQNCYGISAVPSGTWLCKPCSILRRPACILCPKLGGPLKCTPSGTVWCHLTCALWLPELKVVDCKKMEPVLDLDKISHARWSLRCVVCSTTEGACVQCAHKNCRTPFHVTCGLAAGYFLDIQQTASKESTVSRSQFTAYCAKHSDEARKRSDEDDSSCSIPMTVYRRNELKTTHWSSDCYKKFSTFISSTHLHEECPQEYDETLSKKIYEYWINKRLFNKTMPLIKRIEYVFEQRENSELLIAQINACLKTRQKIHQLEMRSKSMYESTSSSSILTQRFEAIKKSFSGHRRRRQRSSSSISSTENERKIKNHKLKSNKRNTQKCYYSFQQYQTIERAKSCMVKLESNFRQNLKLNTTYLIGTTPEEQVVLLPKQLIEQANVITITDDDSLQEQINNSSSTDGEDEIEPLKKQENFRSSKTPYTSQGNVVTCVTGSFN